MTINYLAVIVCAVVAMIIGSIWYGPLFGKFWMSMMGADTMTPEQKAAMKKSMGIMYFAQFVLSIISIVVLSYFINMSGMKGVTMAFWVWFGFLMPMAGGGALWSGKSSSVAWKMFFVTSGANLVTFLAYGLILSAWH